MIRVTRLDRQEIALNSDLIETVESRPDTTIRLVTGLHLVVREPLEEILERIRAWRASLGERGAPTMARVPLSALPPDLEPLERPGDRPARDLLEIPA